MLSDNVRQTRQLLKFIQNSRDLPLRNGAIEMGGNSENGRVVSPKSFPIHLETLSFSKLCKTILNRLIYVSRAQDKRDYSIIIEVYFFLFFNETICYDPSSEPSRRDGSDEVS